MQATTTRPAFVPSLLTFGVVIFAFLSCTVIAALSRWPGPPEARIESREDAHPKRLGEDFVAPYEAAQLFIRHERVYGPPVRRYPVYDYLPQSLLVAWPFASLFNFKSGYYFLIVAGSAALYLLLMACAWRAWRPGAFHYAVMFPVLMFLSEGGSLLYRRGNLDVLPAVGAAAAFLCMLTGKDAAAALFLALMTCVKPMYAPFAVFLFLFAARARMAAVYAGVHLLACSILVLFDRSFSILTDYFRYVPAYVSYMKDWSGGYNIGLLSTLVDRFPSLRPGAMSVSASLLMLALGTLGGLLLAFKEPRRATPERDALPLYFLYFAYVCLLWQCVGMMYASLILLPAIPALDRLHQASASPRLRIGIAAHAVLLGIIFSPYIPRAPLDEKGPFYLLAFIAAIWMLVCRQSQSRGGRTALHRDV